MKKHNHFLNISIKCSRKTAILLWPLFFLFRGPVQAKEAPDLQLDGYMGVQGGESFHYHLDLKDSIGNLMSGYSYTFKDDEKKAVKAYVTAIIDRDKKTLHIREQDIIYNHGFESRATICLVNALLTRDATGGNLSGKLITQTSNNGAVCSSGSLAFIQKSQIDTLFGPQKAPKATEKPITGKESFQTRTDPNQKLHAYFAQKKRSETRQADPVSLKPVVQPPTGNKASKPQIKTITEGQEGVYLWHSDKIIFEIWDGGEIDGDQVTVAYNGRPVLESYRLTEQKKQLTFDIGGNELNIITITANNEGGNPPNTATIKIMDGSKAYSILAYNKTGKAATIQIRKSN
ncbi:MAG TPA: hypothetical protein VFL76_02870 [Edaphocola sp.]|nr:hypothetical protein [Edaphocola sp.]